ncbi:sugar phosphate isomerase/epimerase family protein [Shewanella woodyi]|uniref:sugar phosphate isomerase/epimerase family protein n=1 Tax=Shewanella woodyi TaxID=60961 RepID=UPI0007EB379E|nr:TIM barrel protein [Shewanella woodyi]
MIYLSTGGFSKNTFLETSRLFSNEVIKSFELSSGKYTNTFQADLIEVSKSFSVALHNYFPVPKEPFVFNLASFDREIVNKSLEHAKEAIKISAQAGAEFYSFHAGYLLDPQVSELGKRISKNRLNKRSAGLQQFIKHVNELAVFAKDFNVTLLIENNVISSKNFDSFGCNPLLMTEANETKFIFEQVPGNVKLLIDVAHLKVSANTLKFDPVKFLYEFSDITAGYHISDNNGLEDTNELFTEKSWFVEHIRKDLEYYSLEIYVSEIELLESQYVLLSKILEL